MVSMESGEVIVGGADVYRWDEGGRSFMAVGCFDQPVEAMEDTVLDGDGFARSFPSGTPLETIKQAAREFYSR